MLPACPELVEGLPPARCLLSSDSLLYTLSLFEPADQSIKWWFFVLTDSLD